MVEQSKRRDGSKSELDFSFLNGLPEDQLVDINGAAHLIDHFWDHRRIPNLDLSEMATVLKSTDNEIAIAKRIIEELEKVGKCSFLNLPQDLIDEEIFAISAIWSKKFGKMRDREDPNWRKKAQINLQKMREKVLV